MQTSRASEYVRALQSSLWLSLFSGSPFKCFVRLFFLSTEITAWGSCSVTSRLLLFSVFSVIPWGWRVFFFKLFSLVLFCCRDETETNFKKWQHSGDRTHSGNCLFVQTIDCSGDASFNGAQKTLIFAVGYEATCFSQPPCHLAEEGRGIGIAPVKTPQTPVFLLRFSNFSWINTSSLFCSFGEFQEF